MRDFDPLPVDERQPIPERFSQTLLGIADRCPRSAHLYRKYEGGPQSPPMARGSVFHEFARRATLHLIEHDEAFMPGEVGKDILAGVLSESELVVPASEQDALRLMVWNWCRATAIQPDQVICVEGLLTTELDGLTVSGRLDLVTQPSRVRLKVTDYKTSLNLPSKEKFENLEDENAFQLLLYAILVDESDWSTGVDEYELELVFPRYENDGQLATRSRVIHKRDLPDHKDHLKRLGQRTLRIFTAGEAPAVPGSQCSLCVARSECPIPPVTRPAVPDTVSEAVSLAEAWLLADQDRKDLWAAVKGWCDENGSLQFGDLILEFSRSESRRVKDYDKLIEVAAAGGDVTGLITVSDSTTLRKRRVKVAG